MRRADRSQWLLRAPSPDAPARLFCLPYLGTGASMYHRWPRSVGEAEICPVQLPGRETRLREAVPKTYEETAALLAAELAPYLDRPFAFFAHCNSVFLTVATTIRLAGLGGPAPARLFVSSMVTPHEQPFGSILKVGDDGLGEVIESFMKARGQNPLPELVEMSTGIMRADVEAYRRYALPGPVRLPCPITVFAWTGDQEVPPELTHEWTCYGEVRRVVLEGDHWSFLDPPEALLSEVAADLGTRITSR